MILAAVMLAGCDSKQQDNAAAAPPPPAVTVAPAVRKDVTRSAEFVGRIRAIDKVELRARVEGFLQARDFTEGQNVKSGDLLFVIEQDPYQAALEQQQANLASAQAQVTNTSQQLARARELSRNQNVSQATVDQRVAEDAAARADVLRYQAAVRAAEINLGYTEIRAPISGRIGQATVTPGNLVAPASGVLATIVSEDPIYITFPISQRILLNIQRSGAIESASQAVVRIKLADGSLYPQPGRINFLDNQVNQGTDTILVRAQFPNPDGRLVDGQFATVVVEAEQPQQALVVPQAALQVDQAGPFLLVVSADNKVEERRVTTGASQEGEIVIQSGVQEGDSVIVQGGQRVRPGQTVRPTPAAAAAPARA